MRVLIAFAAITIVACYAAAPEVKLRTKKTAGATSRYCLVHALEQQTGVTSVWGWWAGSTSL